MDKEKCSEVTAALQDALAELNAAESAQPAQYDLRDAENLTPIIEARLFYMSRMESKLFRVYAALLPRANQEYADVFSMQGESVWDKIVDGDMDKSVKALPRKDRKMFDMLHEKLFLWSFMTDVLKDLRDKLRKHPPELKAE